MSAVLAALLLAAAWLAGRRPSSQRLRADRSVTFAALRSVERGVQRARRRRLERRYRAEAATLCAALAAELRAGLMPAAALAAAAAELPLSRSRLELAARAVSRGATIGDELTVAAADLSCARLSVVAAVFVATEVTGSAVADVLERVGRGLTGDDEAAADLDALAAGPRATAFVLAVLPAVAVAFASVLGLSPLPILMHTALGAALTVAAALLEAAGLLWVRRITRRALAG